MVCGTTDRFWKLAARSTPGLWMTWQIYFLTTLTSKWTLACENNYRQEGSQICMFHVDCEIGMPVRIGYIQAKFVMTRAI